MKKENSKPKETLEDISKAFSDDSVKFRRFKGGEGFSELNEGQEIVGVFLSVRNQEIRDRRTHMKKEIRVYTIRVSDGSIKRIGSRAILDRVFDDIMDENGGFIVENKRYIGPGIEWIRNRIIKLIRGEDSESSDGNPMGTYEILVEE